MYLKKMEIKGFKSFPEKTVIVFPKGLISVVGPNGSGKSNIVDALRWVLGEQSIKSLRGEKLEDVIFSGTEKKKEMSYCEVSLLIDNSEKKIDIDYSEISIKRKAFKSGESQFFINNKSCRLKDIKELLLDTGIGREGYSIISQGKVDEIINSNSGSRRKILEEAAGITKYRYKKEESEKKLDTIDKNLQRINDVYFEIEKQVKPLYSQSVKAQKYLDLRNELMQCDVNRFLKSYDEINMEKEKLLSESENIRINIEEIIKRKTEIQSSLEKIKLEENQNRIFINEKRIEEENYKKSIQELITKNEVDLQRLENLVYNEEKNNEKMQLLLEEQSQIEKMIEENKRQIESLNKQKSIIKEEYGKYKGSLDSEASSIKDMDSEMEEIRAEIMSVMNLQSKLLSRSEIISSNISAFKSHSSELEKSLDELSIKKADLDLKIENLKEDLKIKEEEKINIDKKVGSINNDIETAKKSHEEKLSDINSKKIRISDISSRLKVFEKMETEMEGISKGAKDLLKNKNIQGVDNVVANIITVDTGYEKAIEAALGGSLQNLIVSTKQSAKHCIEELKEKRLGKVTFLPLDTIRGSVLSYKDHGIIACNAVTFEKKYDQIVKYLLGKTVIVDNIDKAIEISGKYNNSFKIITLDAQIFHAGGSITGGSVFSSNSIFTRRKNINELKQQLHDLEEEIKNEQMHIEKQNENIGRLTDLQKKSVAESEGINRKISVYEAELSQNILKLEYIDNDLLRLKNEMENTVSSIEESLLSKTKDDKEIEDYEQRINNLKARFNVLVEKKNELQIFNAKNNEVIQKLEIEKSLIKQNLSIKMQEIETSSQKLKGILSQIISIDEDIRSNENKRLLLDKSIMDSRISIDELRINIEALENEINKLEHDNSFLIQEILKLSTEMSEEEEKYLVKAAKSSSIESEVSKIEYKLDLTLERFMDEYSLDLENAKNLKNEDCDTSKAHIDKLRKSIAALGNVNMDSIEEYQKTNERYIFYKEQKADLEDSVVQIKNIIDELEKNMVTEFNSSLQNINIKFDEVFKILFGGGSAKLVMSDPGNLLESEIEINVQPPGKKVRSVSMLSGGEKALCSIAILFSILLIKPVPFCMLDEIDAPLDDANISRFIKLLDIVSELTQFITITHRRGTMESSDYIYGITMQEKGISKVVSLKLEQAQSYVEN